MKQYTDKKQTAKLIELGFPKPKGWGNACISNKWVMDISPNGKREDFNYSIGELIEFLGKNLLTIGVTTILNLPIKHFVRFTRDCTKVGYTQVQGELIDKLFEACVTLKEEGVI